VVNTRLGLDTLTLLLRRRKLVAQGTVHRVLRDNSLLRRCFENRSWSTSSRHRLSPPRRWGPFGGAGPVSCGFHSAQVPVTSSLSFPLAPPLSWPVSTDNRERQGLPGGGGKPAHGRGPALGARSTSWFIARTVRRPGAGRWSMNFTSAVWDGLDGFGYSTFRRLFTACVVDIEGASSQDGPDKACPPTSFPLSCNTWAGRISLRLAPAKQGAGWCGVDRARRGGAARKVNVFVPVRVSPEGWTDPLPITSTSPFGAGVDDVSRRPPQTESDGLLVSGAVVGDPVRVA